MFLRLVFFIGVSQQAYVPKDLRHTLLLKTHISKPEKIDENEFDKKLIDQGCQGR